MPEPTIETDEILPEREDTHDKAFGLQEEMYRLFRNKNLKWKKGQTGEKIYPFPETQEDLLDEYEFPMKMQNELEEERIMKNPLFTRQEWDKWGNDNLIVNSNRKLTYHNGKDFFIPINFYKGITREKGDQFKEVLPFKTNSYAEGTGMFFTTNLDDAHVAPNNTIPKLEEVRITELQKIKDSRKTDPSKPSIVQVHIAPKKRLNLVTYKKDLTFIRDSKDYDKILAATRKLIHSNDDKLSKDEKGLTTVDFNRTLLETVSNADDAMIRKANMTKDGDMFLSNDPYNPLPGQKPKHKEEPWRWKFQHPDRRGQLNIEELTSFLPSGDFSDIARKAGYTAAVIQYHPSSPFMQEMPSDPTSFYEVVLYRT